MLITIATKVVRNDSLLHSRLDEEYVMLNIERGEYYGLNSMASRIWDLLAEEKAAGDIIKLLLTEFEVSEKQCTDEVLGFLNRIYEKGLIIAK